MLNDTYLIGMAPYCSLELYVALSESPLYFGESSLMDEYLTIPLGNDMIGKTKPYYDGISSCGTVYTLRTRAYTVFSSLYGSTDRGSAR